MNDPNQNNYVDWGHRRRLDQAMDWTMRSFWLILMLGQLFAAGVIMANSDESCFPVLVSWGILLFFISLIRIGLNLHTMLKRKLIPSLKIVQRKWRMVKISTYLIDIVSTFVLFIWGAEIEDKIIDPWDNQLKKQGGEACYFTERYLFEIINRLNLIMYIIWCLVFIPIICCWLIEFCIKRYAKQQQSKEANQYSMVKKFSEWLGIEPICAICLGEYLPKDKVRQLNCGHEFHRNCVDEWFLKNKTCPFCSQVLGTEMRDLRSGNLSV